MTLECARRARRDAMAGGYETVAEGCVLTESDGKFSVIRFRRRPSEDPASDDERLPEAG